MNGYIRTNIKERIATIEFFHPAHNSLPGKLLTELRIAIEEVSQNDEVLLVILKSGGERTFCAGASFNELVSIENFNHGKEFFLGFANIINALRKCPKLVIGRVQGKAVGGGVGIASAVDYCLATKYASVRLSELAIGIGPFVIGPAVERKIGLSAFSQMAINANEWQTAEWAKQKGLYNEVFDSTKQLDEHIDNFSRKLVEMNPEALGLLKKVFWENTGHWQKLLEERAELSGRLVLSAFSRKAISSFLKK